MTVFRAHYSEKQLAEAPLFYLGRSAVLPCHIETYEARIALPDANGCILWTRALDTRGYGQLYVRPRMVKTHQIAWNLKHGPIPHGLELDHLCCIPSCCNTDHLEPVSHAENVRRMGERLIFCESGRHTWADQNPYIHANGRRECRPCRNEGKRRRHHAARALQQATEHIGRATKEKS